jgi:hypothetical protein
MTTALLINRRAAKDARRAIVREGRLFMRMEFLSCIVSTQGRSAQFHCTKESGTNPKFMATKKGHIAKFGPDT